VDGRVVRTAAGRVVRGNVTGADIEVAGPGEAHLVAEALDAHLVGTPAVRHDGPLHDGAAGEGTIRVDARSALPVVTSLLQPGLARRVPYPVTAGKHRAEGVDRLGGSPVHEVAAPLLGTRAEVIGRDT